MCEREKFDKWLIINLGRLFFGIFRGKGIF